MFDLMHVRSFNGVTPLYRWCFWLCFVINFCLVSCRPPPLIKETADDSKAAIVQAIDQKLNNRLQLPRPKTHDKKPFLVKPPDHLDAVPLERDGHLNRNFKKEVIFGSNAENEIGNDGDVKKNEEQLNQKQNSVDPDAELLAVFDKADLNRDGHLNRQELESWIHKNTLKHLNEATDENRRVFAIVDQDEDGYLTWEEYHYHFLVDNQLMQPAEAKKHDEAHGDLSPDDQEKIEQELGQWQEADNNPKDGRLSAAEFLGFRHPEHSAIMLESMVKEIMLSLDKNSDGRLSENEFAAQPPGHVEKEWEAYERQYVEERIKEFRDSIDADKDGYATLKEMLAYSNPRNEMHARKEVDELMELADRDKDGNLSKDEVMSHKALFFGSGVMDPGRGMHDEF